MNANILPLGFFNDTMTNYINLEVGKSNPLRKMNVDADFCRTYGVSDIAIPEKVIDAFKSEPIKGNYFFVNYKGQIWRRDNRNFQIELHCAAPPYILP